jgi:putative membrane protein (TIGR04086 family)
MRRYRKSIWDSFIKSVLLCAVSGVTVFMCCLVISAAFTYFFMDDMEMNNIFFSVSFAFGSFCGGHICGRYRRRNGLAEGFICGLIIYIIATVTGIIIFSRSARSIVLVYALIFSTSGGVTGVNTKRPRNLTTD